MTFVVKCAPVLKEWNVCCCSCSLRAASIVLAWFSATANVTQLVSCIVYLGLQNPYAFRQVERTEVVVSMLSALVGSLILDALLLYGIHRKKSVYMLPFLVMNLIAIFVLAGIILLLTVLFMADNWLFAIILLFLGTAFIALYTFFWVVHYSYYRQIEEEKNSNNSIVNYTYGLPTETVQITACPEDEKALCPYPTKASAELA